MREKIIKAGFDLLKATRADRLFAPLARGLGAILMFHNVRPFAPAVPGYAPNRLLEITPGFLDAVLARLEALDFDVVTLDEALERMAAPRPGGRRFAALTFDDGYRDTRDFALPVLRRHKAPFTLFVTTGFADQTARLWWLELEAAVGALEHAELRLDDGILSLPSVTATEKTKAFQMIYARLRAGKETRLLDAVTEVSARAGVTRNFAAELCLDWRELAAIAADPLCTIGAHTLTHPMLAKHGVDFVRREMAESRRLIAEKLGAAPRHFAYPVGDPASAGPREFDMARALGFASAVTTRPGMIFAGHAARPTALPRLSVNGNWQDVEYIDILLTGVPFALWNKGRRVPAL